MSKWTCNQCGSAIPLDYEDRAILPCKKCGSCEASAPLPPEFVLGEKVASLESDLSSLRRAIGIEREEHARTRRKWEAAERERAVKDAALGAVVKHFEHWDTSHNEECPAVSRHSPTVDRIPGMNDCECEADAANESAAELVATIRAALASDSGRSFIPRAAIEAIEVFLVTDKYAARQNTLAMVRAALQSGEGK